VAAWPQKGHFMPVVSSATSKNALR